MQDVFSATKVIALITIIIIGIVWMGMGHLENLENPMLYSNYRWDIARRHNVHVYNFYFSPGHIALAFYSGIFSYAGWNYLNFVTEEIKNPNVNLPRAIYISMPSVTVIYLLANVAYFAVLTPTEILSSNAVAVSFAGKIMGVMAWIMPVFVACSTFGSVNGGIFASSRIFFVGARNGHMPRSMALVNVNARTPMPCLIILGLITLAMLSSNDVYELINYTSFLESLFITVSVSGLLWLRYKQPKRDRPIKVRSIIY